MAQSSAISRGLAVMVASATFGLVFGQDAYAMNTCRGAYSGSLVRPLPTPNVVQYEPETNDPATLTDLGLHFLTGLQRGGVITTGQPKTRLYIVSVVTPSSGVSAGHGRAGLTEDTSASEATTSRALNLALTLRDIQTTDTIWIGSLSCTILTNNKMQVAESIGELLGRAVGKDFGTRQFQTSS